MQLKTLVFTFHSFLASALLWFIYHCACWLFQTVKSSFYCV